MGAKFTCGTTDLGLPLLYLARDIAKTLTPSGLYHRDHL